MSAEQDQPTVTTTSPPPPLSPPDGATDGSTNLFTPVTAPIDLRGTPDGPPQWPVERGPLPESPPVAVQVAVETAQQSSNPWMEPDPADQDAGRSSTGRYLIDPPATAGSVPGQDLIARGGMAGGPEAVVGNEAGLAVLRRLVNSQADAAGRDGERARDPHRALRLRRSRIRTAAFVVVLLPVGALLAGWVDVRRDAWSALAARVGVVRDGDGGPPGPAGPTPDGGQFASPAASGAPVEPGPEVTGTPVAPSDPPVGETRTTLPTGRATPRPARVRPSVARSPARPGTSAPVGASGPPAAPGPATSGRSLPQYSAPVKPAEPKPKPEPERDPAPAPEPKPKPVRTRSGSAEVPAVVRGVAGIEVRDGGTVTLTAGGEVVADRPGEDDDGCVGVTTFDPDGERSLAKDDETCQPLLNADRAVAPSEPVGALLVRVGDGPWRLAGSDRTFRVREGGRLSFAVNLLERAGAKGAFDVSYQVADPS